MGPVVLLVLLMNLCSFSVSQNYVYHFINESKSWEEAQSFCRKNYTDLATVENMTDMETLTKAGAGSGAGPGAGAGAWIGLYNKTSRVWHWSLPGVEFNEEDLEHVKSNDNDNGGRENCVYVDNSKYWSDAGCGVERCFICYNATTNDPFIKDNDNCRNWTAAQHFCRETHTDLISGLDQLNQTKMGGTKCNCAQDSKQWQWWIGLSRDTWGWSDGSNSSFRNWSLNDEVLNKNFDNDNKACVKVGPEGTFIRDSCTRPSPFICYDNLFILVKENKTWEEALYYCRRNHRDLAWFMDPTHLKNMVQRRAQMANSDAVWVGLHYTCFLEAWIWVNGDYVSDTDENWKVPGESECGVAGAMERDGKNQWVKRNSWETLNFICLS